MDFPPLDDTRWDSLLGAVIGQRPTVGDPDTPLATTFPRLADHRLVDSAVEDDTHAEDGKDAHCTTDLDAYA